MSAELVGASAPVEEEPTLLGRALRGLWERLPALLLGSVVAAAGLALPALVLPVTSPLFPLAAAVTLAAASGPLASAAQAAIGVQHGSIRELVRRGFGAAARLVLVALPLAFATALTSLAWQLFLLGYEPWLLVPAALGGVLSLGSAAVALSGGLRSVDPAPPRASDLLLGSALSVLGRPFSAIAAVIVALFVVWLTLAVNAVLVLVFAPPAAVLVAALLSPERSSSPRA